MPLLTKMVKKLPETIFETQKGLVNKDFSAVELVDTYLAKIEKFNSDLNACITVTKETAFDKAKVVDKIISDLGPRAIDQFPLLGVTTVYKDLYLTEGIRSSAGSRVLEGYVPGYSSTVVDRVQKAGAIMLAKTNCDAWAHGASGENSDFGPTKNPWDKAYVPGGSSSGSAVCVASGFSLTSFGTDTGGSIRQPAGFCNIVGFKPTYGAVSRYGVIAMASSLDCMGHFARSVTDIKRIFEVTRGIDGKDSTVVAVPWKKPKTKFKIGLPKEYFIEGIDPEVEKLVKASAGVFEKENIELVEVSLPHTKYAIDVYYIVQPAEVSSNLGRYDGVRYGNERDSFGDEAKRRIMLGTYVLSSGYYDAYYLKAMKVRSKIIEDFENVFNSGASDVDVILTPVSPTPPFKIGEKSSDPLQMYLADIFTVSANLAGIPGLAIPAGFTKSGLPVGFQLMGPKFSEPTLFELGKLYQAKTDWHKREPKL